MVSTVKLPKHVLSKNNYKAKHDHICAWLCGKTIKKGSMYVRIVWEDDKDEVFTDHICVDCWEAP